MPAYADGRASLMERHGTIAHLIPQSLLSDKPIEIQLAWYLNDYKVVAIQNSTILKPGEWLSVTAVNELCSAPGWTVKMADNDLIAVLFGIGAGAIGGASKL